MSWSDLAARTVLGLVFAVALAAKLRTRRTFRGSLTGLGWLPARFATPAALLITAAEAATLALLCLPGPAGFAAAAALLAAFAAGIALTIHKGQKAHCHCFGSSGGVLGTRHIARNVMLILVAVIGTAGTGPPDPATAVLATGLGALLAAAVVHWDELAFLLRAEKS